MKGKSSPGALRRYAQEWRSGISIATSWPIGVPYVRGWYEKQGAQLYMNRGIGTTGFPIRLGARPEITLFELTR